MLKQKESNFLLGALTHLNPDFIQTSRKIPVDICLQTLYNHTKGIEGKSSAEPIPQRAGVAENRRIRLSEHGSGAPHAILSVRRAFPLQMRLMFVGH